MSLRDAMNQMFDESFWDPWKLWDSALPAFRGGFGQQCFVPSIDISENDKQITVVADIPGYDPEDIEASFNDNVLTLQGKMHEENEEQDEKKKWYRRECSSGSFYQQFALPSYAEGSGIKCKAKNGKLTVTIPKKAEKKESSSKKLEIEVD